MLLYADHTSPRLLYVLDFISGELLHEAIAPTRDRAAFDGYEGPKIDYSAGSGAVNAFHVSPAGLLAETGIRQQEIDCFEHEGLKAFFATPGDFPFDIFSAVFYLISRYEEYLPHPRDEYGRFDWRTSLAAREGFLDFPLVNAWLASFREALLRKYPSLGFRQPRFKFIPTYDIDMAWSYRSKGWWRNTGGFLRSMFRGEWSLAKDRWLVLRGRRRDPFDAYEWLDSLHLYCRTRAYYFFLLADARGRYDKNIDPHSQAMRDLVSYHSRGYTVGIHPSWQSGDDPRLLKREIATLAEISEKKVNYSRQHYLRMSLPDTYRKLIAAGIGKDFSMGYGPVNGFRASVASSFFWYDLEAEAQTALEIFPFCFMDAAAFHAPGGTAAAAFDEMMRLYGLIRKFGGLMVTIWHNHYLGTEPRVAGWREAYEIFLREEIYWEM